MTTHDQFHQFRSTFDGTTLTPQDAGFDDARVIHNATHQHLVPALILRPRSAQGVAQAVQYAQQAGLTIAVRGGGHSPAGNSSVHGGLVIDLRDMTRIDVNPATRRVRVEPGLTWAEVAEHLHPYGLAITSGDVGTVGVAGLTQGGGIGWFVREHGLTIDRLRSAELVTADGKVMVVSAEHHPDVFWALRGAGANLGVITALEFEAHAGGVVYGGMIGFEVNSAAEAARLTGEFARRALAAPDSLTMQGIFMAAPPAPFVPDHLIGKTLFVVLSVCSAPLEDAPAIFAPIRDLGTAAFDLTGPVPYPVMFDFTREGGVTGLRHLIRSGFLNELPTDALMALGQAVQTMPPGQMVQLRPLGGAMARVAPEATAFQHRHHPFLMMVVQMVPEQAPAPEVELARAGMEFLWAPFAPLSAALYSNFASELDAQPAQRSFPQAALHRVAQVKAQLDPHNIFARNVNVQPHRPVLSAR